MTMIKSKPKVWLHARRMDRGQRYMPRLEELARRADCDVRDVAEYEAFGLLGPVEPRRPGADLVSSRLVAWVRLVSLLFAAGLGPGEVRALWHSRRSDQPAADAARALRDQLRAVRPRVREHWRRLARLDRQLRIAEATLEPCLACERAAASAGCRTCPAMAQRDSGIPEVLEVLFLE
jgi:hypothetical protein